MRKIFILLCCISLFACHKSQQENVNQVAKIVEFQDHALSLFTVAYDVMTKIDSPSTVSMFQNCMEVVWIDSLFNDGNGIEAFLTFHNYDSFSSKYLYGFDKKLRKGLLYIEVNHSLSNQDVTGQIAIVDSIQYNSGYYIKKMKQLNGSLFFSRNGANSWVVSLPQMKYQSGLQLGMMSFEGEINLSSDSSNGLIGATLSMKGSSKGVVSSDFKTEIKAPLEINFSKECSGMYRVGEQQVQFKDDTWTVNYNAFNTGNCDRYIKLEWGRQEYFRPMY